MGKSLKEYCIALGYWWFIVIVPIALDTISICELVSGNQFTRIPSWIWFQIAFVFALIIPFIAFHKLRVRIDEKQKELDIIKNERPKIEVTVRKQYDDFDVEVLNKGEDAEFEAQIEVFDGKGFVLSLPQNYSAYWEKTKNDKIELKKGQKGHLKIASLQISRPISTPIPMMNFSLHYYEITHFENSTFPIIACAQSTTWIPGDTQTVKPCISLRVTISSSPSMADGAFVRSYQLSDKGLVEINS